MCPRDRDLLPSPGRGGVRRTVGTDLQLHGTPKDAQAVPNARTSFGLNNPSPESGRPPSGSGRLVSWHKPAVAMQQASVTAAVVATTPPQKRVANDLEVTGCSLPGNGYRLAGLGVPPEDLVEFLRVHGIRVREVHL